MWGTSTAADAITLKGGTLAVGGISGTEGDWTWGQPITLGTGTTSKISGQNAGTTARTLTLSGAIVGSGNLTFEKTQTAAQIFVISNVGTTAGVRTNVMGSGDITVNGVTLQPRAGGTANVITYNNNVRLNGGTIISDDGFQTYAGTISLEGANVVQARYNNKPITINGAITDGAVPGSVTFSSNTINLNGTNTYTGGTTITAGTALVTSGKGFGTGLVTGDGGSARFDPATVGATSTISAIRSRSDVLLENNVLLDITSGTLQERQTNGFWFKASGTGTVGRLTSSSGTLNLSSVDVNWVTTTGDLGTADHQIQTPIVDFNGTTPLALTKSGVNQVQFTTANTYSGGTTINAGLIRANNAAGFGTGPVTVMNGAQAHLNAGAGVYANNFTIAGVGPTEATGNFGALRFNNNTISGSVAIGAAGARIGGTGASGTLSGALTGSGPLEINSAAAGANGGVILSGNASGYTGAITISQGSLTVGPTTSLAGPVTKLTGSTLINNGTIGGGHVHTVGGLQGTGTFTGGLTLNGATSADYLNVVPGALHVTGNVVLSGTTTVRASGLGGTVPVLYYTGSLTGSAANLTLENAASFRPGTQFNTGTAGLITLDVVGVPITWTAANSMDWDTTTVNWSNAGNPDKYFQSDIVTFGDTGAGTINVVGTISPKSITINNSAGNNYTFTAAAGSSISGTTGITKTGDGALTLATSNTFLGAVSLSGGTTTFAARQAYTGGTAVNSGAVLDLTGGGGAGGTISGTVNVNAGILRLTTGDATGFGVGTDRISVLNITNGGALEINNAAANQTLSNLAITLTGSTIRKGDGAAFYNGNIDLFSGSTTLNSQASADTSYVAAGINVGLRQPVTVMTTALGTTASGIDLEIDGTINNSPYDFATPALTKEGPGTLCLNNPLVSGIGGTSVYTGVTTINNGTLLVGTGGTQGVIGTGAIVDNSVLAFNRSDAVTLANAITGTGTLVQQGEGNLTLTTGGTRSGETKVTAGRLYTGIVPFTASTFRASPGGTLGTGTPLAVGTGTVPALALSGGTATFRVNTTTSDKLIVTANNGFTVTAPSQISCTPSGNLQTNDVIPLIDYAGAIGGSGFAGLSLAATGNPHLSFALVNNLVDTRVDVKVTAADTLIWKGNIDNVWDENGTSNWLTSSNNLTSLFYEFDKVKFTDAGSANTSVYLSGQIVPNTVEFAATIDYTLTGDGISGPASLVKNGSGIAYLTNENTYTGTTTVNTGTLSIGDGTGLGSLAADSVITNNATLAFNRPDNVTVANAISGTGQLVKRGTGRLVLSGVSTFSGPVVVEAGTLAVGNTAAFGTTDSGITVNSGATLDMNNVAIPTGETVSIKGTGVAGYALTGIGNLQANLVLTGNATVGNDAGDRIDLGTGGVPITITGAYTLTKASANSVWYRGPTNGTGNSLAALVVDNGVFGIESHDNALNAVPITVNATGTLSSWGSVDNIPTTQNNPITLNGGSLASDYPANVWSGPVTLTADSTLGGPLSAQDFIISGAISQTGGARGLVKTEISAVTLAGINTYTGNTTVNAGTIHLADDAGLKFAIGANGVSTKITGAGTATLDGDFTLDLSGAAIANGNSWTLVDTAVKTFGPTFTLVGFSEAGDVHTMTSGGQTWTFTEATGVLSVTAGGGSGFSAWAALYAPGQTPSMDHDSDGVPNGVEYFMGATGSTFTANPSVVAGKVTWPKNATFSGTYLVRTSPDLVNWTTATTGVVDMGNAVQFTVPTVPGKLFVRLAVTPN